MNEFINYRVDDIEKKRVIVCAAMGCTATGSTLCGVRHGDDTMFSDDDLDIWISLFDEQGFVDNKGNFLTREEAWIVAYDAGQIRYICGGQSCERDGGRLYSENLY